MNIESELSCRCRNKLRGGPFDLGGGGGVGDFEKYFLLALVGRKNCMQRKCNRKNSCSAVRKKHVAKLFHHSFYFIDD